MNVPMEQWDGPKWYFPMMKTLQAISDIGVLVVEWLLPSILTWYREKIMEIDLSLNRSLEELVSSYFEAYEAGFGCDSFLAVNVNSTAADVSDYYVLENYLSDYGAI